MSAPATSGQAPVMLRWIGQAGFELYSPSGRAVFDPFLSDYPGRLVPAHSTAADLAQADVILVSHEHADHFDVPALVATMRIEPGPLLVLPAPLIAAALDAGLPRQRLRAVQPGDTLYVNDMRIDVVAACHGVDVGDAYNFGTEISDGLVRYLGYVLTLDGVVVYHAGDTLDHDDLAAQLAAHRVAVALLPINGRDAQREELNLVGNLNPAEAADLANRADVAVVVAMHFDMFATNLGDPEQFADIVAEHYPRLRVVIPTHGTAVDLSALLT